MYIHGKLGRTAKKAELINTNDKDFYWVYNTIGQQIFVGNILSSDELLKLGFVYIEDFMVDLVAKILDEHQKSKSHTEIYERLLCLLNRYIITPKTND